MKLSGPVTAVLLLGFAPSLMSVGALGAALPMGAPPAPPAHVNSAEADASDEIHLNTNITVTGNSIHLSDIFTGYLSRPEKVVAPAPKPGQRVVLSAEWLTNLAHTYGLNWHPAGVYDRAVAYQPGLTIAQNDILSAVRTALIAKGMPANFDVMPTSDVDTVTVAVGSSVQVGVREAYFDPTAKVFTAVVEIPAGDPKGTFVPLHGVAYATVAVPVLKENVSKNKIITAAMVDIVNVREEAVKSTTVTDPNLLIGKAPKFFVKAGQPVQDSEIALIHLVDVPVLEVDASRESLIGKGQITMAPFNAADLPQDAVLDASQLIGRTPRRYLPAGLPIRRSDVQIVRQVQVPVVARDVARGEMLARGDLTTITLTDAEVIGNIVTDINEIIGRAAKHAMRAGTPMHTYDIARPVAVERGKMVTIVYSAPMMNLTVQGVAQEQGGVGDAIRVTNSKSNTVVTAEVVDAHTVRISTRQTASAN